ncbi:MAG: hypothetical protein CML68_13595 [Rhodobacteraceae bacterium]|nr:hypothetical protein [Paracoccaceae bacterium]
MTVHQPDLFAQTIRRVVRDDEAVTEASQKPLREYQAAAIRQIYHHLHSGLTRVVLVAPCGSEEAWVLIDGYERYAVSDQGRVYSSIRAGRLVKATVFNTGYKTVSLMRLGSSKPDKISVHRIVAAAFVAGSGPYVNHIDGDKQNNAATNLEWCTAAENNSHARETGLNRDIGEGHHNSRLSVSDVQRIRAAAKNGATQQSLADRFGVGRAHVGRIIARQVWKEVPDV